MQEVLNNQLLNILTDSNAGNTTSEWAYIGVGRDDGRAAGEYSPIVYRPTIWDLQSLKTVWLSPTPDVPTSGRPVVATCTRLDNAGTVFILNSAKIIIDRINQYTGISNGTKPSLPVFLGGDFNSEPDQEAYLEMSKAYAPVYDLRLKVPEAQRYGNNLTFTGFTDSASDDSLIDFLWLGPKNESFWSVKDYGVLANKLMKGSMKAIIGPLLEMLCFFEKGIVRY